MNTIKIIFFALLYSCILFGQQGYRMKASLEIRSRNIDSTLNLTKGTVFYDRNFKQLTYDLTFPKKEQFVQIDTMVYHFQLDKLVTKKSNPVNPTFSIFHFALLGNLSDFGLSNTSYKPIKVKKENDLISTMYAPPLHLKKALGNIEVFTQNRKLHSVIILDANNNLVSKQYFKKYVKLSNIDYPTEILSVNYIGNKKSFQVITLSNIVINENNNDAAYKKVGL